MNYLSGRSNLACTIFVPYDCNNKCPFCTSKSMYKTEEMNLEEILKSIEIVNKWNWVKEFVITGGEPFADIDKLAKIVSVCNKPVFINTTLPLVNAPDAINFINNTKGVYGVNISRQFNDNCYSDIITGSEYLELIEKPKRINVLCVKGYEDKLDEFIKKYGVNSSTIINLRADYRKVTVESLKVRDSVVDYLAEKYNSMGGGGCLVCNTDIFTTDDNITIQYHRGLQYSAVRYSNKTYINDIIIKPNGKMYDDWDFKNELNEKSLK